MDCACGRDVPVVALWLAFLRESDLRCTSCQRQIAIETLRSMVDTDEYMRVCYAALQQIRQYGWTSIATLMNAGATDGGKWIGGFLSGLQRAGLIQRCTSDDEAAAFEAGPNFPVSRETP
jgi:hypothetical protein